MFKRNIENVPDLLSLITNGRNLLHLACYYDQPAFVEYLLQLPNMSADIVNQLDYNQMSPLCIAATHNMAPIVKMLLRDPRLKQGAATEINKYLFSPLSVACTRHFPLVTELLLCHCDSKTTIPQYYHNWWDESNMENIMDKFRDDPEGEAARLREKHGIPRPPVAPPTSIPSTSLVHTISPCYIIGKEEQSTLEARLRFAAARSEAATAEVLALYPEICVNEPDEYMDTALHLSVQSRFCQSSAVLLAHPGIDVNVRDNTGRTPLMYLCSNPTETLSLFLEDARVDASIVSEEGQTAFWFAVSQGSVYALMWLIASGKDLGDPETKGVFGITPLTPLEAWKKNSRNITTDTPNRIPEIVNAYISDPTCLRTEFRGLLGFPEGRGDSEVAQVSGLVKELEIVEVVDDKEM